MERDRYEIGEVVGSGGMATVWRARDTRLRRTVAIKRPKSLGQDSVDAVRFEREARAAATVAHPNVVAVHDAGVDEAGPYLVMELVDGPSLATADVPADRVARIGVEVASALAALHAGGVVHGDVKPANILLSPDGAKLTDFGIARAVDDTMTMSSPAVVFGTPAYAAPETLSQAERSAAADVYSLAAVLYEALTGTRWNATQGATRAMPPTRWAGVLEPALSPDPARRPTAAELAASLAAIEGAEGHAPTTPLVPLATRSDHGPTTSPLAPSPGGWQLAVAAFAIGSVVLIVLALLLSRDGTDVSGGNTQSPVTIPALVAETTVVPATSVSATEPTVPHTEPTVPPTTAPPATTPPATTAPQPTAADTAANELIALIESLRPKDVKPKDADRIIERIDEVMRVAADRPGETEPKLREAAKQIHKHVHDEAAHERAQDLLLTLADALGVPAETVTQDPKPRK